jgi:hypothetical protein
MQSSLHPPQHTVFRDPSKVDSGTLERTVDRLGRTVTAIRERGGQHSLLLLDAIAECEIQRGFELQQAGAA